MFQEYAVTYTLQNNTREFATTINVDLERAKAEKREEFGAYRLGLLREMIAIRQLGSAGRASEVTITESVRLGEPFSK